MHPTLTRAWRRWHRAIRKQSPVPFLLTWALLLTFFLAYFYTSGPRVQLDPATDFWRGRHAVFCVSPGRSGSLFLASVLGVGKGVFSRHEPSPRMHDVVLRDVLIHGQRAETFRARTAEKVGAMREALEGTPPSVVYAETSHMFLKTFADVVLHALGDLARVSILVLHRPRRDVVWSQLQLGWFSPNHSGRDVWYYGLGDVHPTERMVPNVTTTSEHFVDALIEYNADIDFRARALERSINDKHKRGAWSGVRLVHVQLADLAVGNTSGVESLLSSLGLQVEPARLNLLREQDVNDREVKKDRVHVTGSLSDVDARIRTFYSRLSL